MNIKASFQIEIPKRGDMCAQGKEPLIPGMEIHSVLRESLEDQGLYERQDYCNFCWEQLCSQNTIIGSIWKSKIPFKNEAPNLPKQRDARAMSLLKEALMRNGKDDHAEAFILALYLARRRLMYFRQELVLEDGQAASVFEVADTEEMLCVRKISLSTLHIEKIQRELAIKFRS